MNQKAMVWNVLLFVLLVAALPLSFPVAASAAGVMDIDVVGAVEPDGVVLTSLKAEIRPDGVLLTWETANESSIVGFNVFRRVSSTLQAGWDAEGYGVLNQDFIFAEYAGANQGAWYSYKDAAVEPGMTCEYALQVSEPDGRTAIYRVNAVMTRWWLHMPSIVG